MLGHETPSVSPTRPRKPRRTNVRLASSSPAPVSAAPAPAWGPSYYKPRPGFGATLEQLRSSIGNDQNTSYILGDLLEARYGKLSDVRDSYFQEQRQEAEHQYELADIYAREGEEYTPDLPDIEGIPKGQGPRGLLKELMQVISSNPGDQKYAEGVTRVYQDRIEDALDIKNDIRDYKGSVKSYAKGHEDYLEELGARGEGPNGGTKGYQSPYGDTNIPVIGDVLDLVDPNRPRSRYLKQVGETLPKVIGNAVPDIFDKGSGVEESDNPNVLEAAWKIGFGSSIVGTPLADNPPDLLRKMDDEFSDGFWYTLDKLSRPIYGTAKGVDTYAGMDEDERGEKKGILDAVASSGLLGINPLKSLDEFAKKPWAPAQGFLEGFHSGDLAGYADDPTTFSEVIKNEADRNPGDTIHDSKQYQLWAGLTADIALDPLNLVGVGLVKAPINLGSRAVGSIQETAEVNKMSREIAKYFDETKPFSIFDDAPLSKQEIHDLLTLKNAQPVSKADRIDKLKQVQSNTDYIMRRMEGRRARPGVVPSDLSEMQARLAARRDEIITESGNESYMQSLSREFGLQVRKGESNPEELNEILTTAALAKRFHYGINYERRMDEIAKKFGLDKTPDGASVAAPGMELEKHYARAVEQFKRGEISQKSLDKLRVAIDDALDDGNNAFHDINAWMSYDNPAWKADPRWTDEEARLMLRQADKLARDHARTTDIYSQLGSQKRMVTGAEKTVERFAERGFKLGKVQAEKEAAQAALSRTEQAFQLRRADYMMRLMKAHIARGEGKTTYRSTQEARTLMAARDEVRALRDKAAVGSHTGADESIAIPKRDKQGNIIYKEGSPATNAKDKGLPKPVYEGSASSSVQKRSLADLDEKGELLDEGTPDELFVRNADGEMEFDKTLLEPNAKFSDYQQQLTYLEKRINNELRFMEYSPDRPFNAATLDAQDRMLGEIPPRFMDEDGQFNFEALREHFQISPKRGIATIKPTGDPQVDAWLEDVKSVYQAKYNQSEGKRYNNFNRRANEQRQAQAENNFQIEHDKPLTNDQIQVMSMWGKPSKGSEATLVPGSKGLSPVIDVDKEIREFAVGMPGKGKYSGSAELIESGGERVEYGSKRFRELVSPTSQDIRDSETYARLLSEIANGEGTKRHQAIGRLRDHLFDAGQPVPKSAAKVIEWIMGARKQEKVVLKPTKIPGEKVAVPEVSLTKVPGLTDLFSPDKIAFRRMFKEQHGMTIRQAMELRDEVAGNTVTLGGPWGKEWKDGVNKSRFIAEMTNSVEDFIRMTWASPFKVRIGTVKSNKTVRDEIIAAGGESKVPDEKFKAWAKINYDKLMEMTPAQRQKSLDSVWKASFDQQTAQKAKRGKKEDNFLIEHEAQKIDKRKPTNAQWDEFRQGAMEDAWKYIQENIEKGTIPIEVENQSLRMLPGLESKTTPDDIYKAMQHRLTEEESLFKLERKAAKDNAEELLRIDNELAKIGVKKQQLKAQHVKRLKEAAKTKEAMQKYLKEDAYMRMAALDIARQEKSLTFNVLGKALEIPGTRQLFRATDTAAGFPIIKQMRQVAADLFKSPASQLESTSQLARSRALGQTPIIIENDVKHLKNLFSGMDQTTRERTLKAIVNNSDIDSPEALRVKEAFDATFMEHFQSKVKIGDATLYLDDINRYLPEDMRMYTKGVSSFDTPQALIKNIMRNNPNAPKDPFRLSWNLRIGYHQAAARKMTEQMVMKGFGVRKLGKGDAGYEGVRGLERLGWKEIPELSDTYLFHPEAIPDIRALFKMLEPREIEAFGRLMDRSTGYWKTITTVYNPGYWTRNAVGEAMSSWFAGVHGVKPYSKAKTVVSYARKDGQELDALRQQFSFMNYVPSPSVKGNQDLGITRGGHKLTPENVWVLFNDRGLKTGFFNTEFDHQFSVLGNKARTLPGTEYAAKAHVGVRSAGEWYEDYFRIAHFVDALEKSGAKTLESAADEAAAVVRKYHFDYTDFTPFEKTVMLRTFPFYKWTRKALPLMLTMLFTKPGKVVAYPKVMNTLSNSLTTHDVGGDDNGFAPNYEGIVPSWIQDLWGYQIAETGPEDEFGQQNETYFNLATPQMDSYKALTNPGGTAYGLLNPFFKAADQQVVEQVSGGHSLGDLLSGNGNYEFGEQTGNSYETDALKSLLKLTPQTNLAQKDIAGEPSLQDILGFMTGLGIYESDTPRRQGEAWGDR